RARRSWAWPVPCALSRYGAGACALRCVAVALVTQRDPTDRSVGQPRTGLAVSATRSVAVAAPHRLGPVPQSHALLRVARISAWLRCRHPMKSLRDFAGT